MDNIENTPFLYPHLKECFRIVVPQIKTTRQIVEKLSHNKIVQSILLCLLLLIIVRMLLNWSQGVHNYTDTFYSIFAALLGQQEQKMSPKLWKNLYTTMILYFAVIFIASLSAISYKALVSVEYVKQLDTIDDLINSNLRILVESDKSRVFENINLG